MRLASAALLLSLGLAASPALAQPLSDARPTAGPRVDASATLVALAREGEAAAAFDPALAPFYHGVASGDPLPTGVVLWTRVTPEAEGPVEVRWTLYRDAARTQPVQGGVVTTDAGRDYTVKVDVRELAPGTTYYYTFAALGRTSLVGRTRTASADASQLRFALVSCSNYPAGYFNAYARIAERADLDAVFHLGDYLYEYDGRSYGAARAVTPDREIVTLADYRGRYSLYRLDPDLRRAHQQHPFIAVWDDHESANDAYRDGAQNHTPATEGAWEDRKAAAKRAYFEWMPIREQLGTGRIYRRLPYGTLADVVMIDTRLEGRQQQLAVKGGTTAGVDTAAWVSEARTLLGQPQYDWLVERLATSTARWKLVGNQVMMMRFAPHPRLPAAQTFTNLDAWDGYPAERRRLLSTLLARGVRNTVVMTGDIHSSWAADLPVEPFGGYNPATGAGSAAVEATTTSVTSSTFADGLRAAGVPLETANAVFAQAYPQLKAFNLSERGYAVLDLTPARAQADYFFVDIDARKAGERPGPNVYTLDGQSFLQRATGAAPGKPNPPALAPETPPVGTSVAAPEAAPGAGLVVVGVYPNPARGPVGVEYALATPGAVRIELFDAAGRRVRTLVEGDHAAGVFQLDFDTAGLAAGAYRLRVEAAGRVLTRSLVVVR